MRPPTNSTDFLAKVSKVLQTYQGIVCPIVVKLFELISEIYGKVKKNGKKNYG